MKELGPEGIRVDTLAPGAVNVRDMPRSAELFAKDTALGQIEETDDIARLVTGKGLTVSGGGRLRMTLLKPDK